MNPYWLMLKAAFGGVLKVIKSIPLPVWLFIGGVCLALWYGERRHGSGIAQERERWEAMEAAANDAQAKQAAKDAGTSAGITGDTQKRTGDAVVDTRTKTATAVERVRYETRTIVVPADCAAALRLPDGVSREGREAIERANAAHRPMQRAGNP